LLESGDKAYFPNGKDDPNIGLIKVKVYQAEYWEAPYGVATKLLGFARG
jgi:general stress protein 26